MNPLTPNTERFLFDGGISLTIGGLIFLLLGTFLGWIIWRNACRLAQSVEERNRAAIADFERSSDEISRIKSELAGNGQ